MEKEVYMIFGFCRGLCMNEVSVCGVFGLNVLTYCNICRKFFFINDRIFWPCVILCLEWYAILYIVRGGF